MLTSRKDLQIRLSLECLSRSWMLLRNQKRIILILRAAQSKVWRRMEYVSTQRGKRLKKVHLLWNPPVPMLLQKSFLQSLFDALWGCHHRLTLLSLLQRGNWWHPRQPKMKFVITGTLSNAHKISRIPSQLFGFLLTFALAVVHDWEVLWTLKRLWNFLLWFTCPFHHSYVSIVIVSIGDNVSGYLSAN